MRKVRKISQDEFDRPYDATQYAKRGAEAKRKPEAEAAALDPRTLDFLASAVDGGNEGVLRQYGWGKTAVPIKNQVWQEVARRRDERGDTAGYNEAG